MNAPFPFGDRPAYSPGAGYEAPIYDRNGVKHEPGTEEWFRIVYECADEVFYNKNQHKRWKRFLTLGGAMLKYLKRMGRGQSDPPGKKIRKDNASEEPTLEDIVRRYLRKLDNPAPDPIMRNIYRCWMAEFVEEPYNTEDNNE